MKRVYEIEVAKVKTKKIRVIGPDNLEAVEVAEWASEIPAQLYGIAEYAPNMEIKGKEVVIDSLEGDSWHRLLRVTPEPVF